MDSGRKGISTVNRSFVPRKDSQYLNKHLAFWFVSCCGRSLSLVYFLFLKNKSGQGTSIHLKHTTLFNTRRMVKPW